MSLLLWLLSRSQSARGKSRVWSNNAVAWKAEERDFLPSLHLSRFGAFPPSTFFRRPSTQASFARLSLSRAFDFTFPPIPFRTPYTQADPWSRAFDFPLSHLGRLPLKGLPRSPPSRVFRVNTHSIFFLSLFLSKILSQGCWPLMICSHIKDWIHDYSLFKVYFVNSRVYIYIHVPL